MLHQEKQKTFTVNINPYFYLISLTLGAPTFYTNTYFFLVLVFCLVMYHLLSNPYFYTVDVMLLILIFVLICIRFHFSVCQQRFHQHMFPCQKQLWWLKLQQCVNDSHYYCFGVNGASEKELYNTLYTLKECFLFHLFLAVIICISIDCMQLSALLCIIHLCFGLSLLPFPSCSVLAHSDRTCLFKFAMSKISRSHQPASCNLRNGCVFISFPCTRKILAL